LNKDCLHITSTTHQQKELLVQGCVALIRIAAQYRNQANTYNSYTFGTKSAPATLSERRWEHATFLWGNHGGKFLLSFFERRVNFYYLAIYLFGGLKLKSVKF